ncbi:sigma-54-dependent transcriptional regulator [Frigidibacter sp. MR17.24]|uniref:sigma-54-dependent transcriptional regulator n=1 Tax=Frigidibacter sp. MR17.24 TaxID=3127345 RepID=UPI003012A689
MTPPETPPETRPETDAPLVRLIDDDPDLLAAQIQSLRRAGFRVEPFADPRAALEGLGPDYPGVVLSDVRMPGLDGFELQRLLAGRDPDLPVILLTGHGDVPMAVAALKAGAWDFLTKPVARDELTAALRRATAARALVIENRALRQLAREAPPPADPVLDGDSAPMRHLRAAIGRLAESGAEVLILGPAGSGKSAVAEALHRDGPLRARPFVTIDCPTLDPARFEAEMLGSPGAAGQGRVQGRLERAHRGTLYLSGIDRLAPVLQPRLLALIEASEIWPPGAAAARPLDLRLLASSREDLGRMAEEGRLLPDLHYRLSGVALSVPPLAARREDLPALFRRLLVDTCTRGGLPLPQMTVAVRARLAGHGWPGNLRELRQFVEATALGLAPLPGGDGDGTPPGLGDLVADYEAELIREALRLSSGNASRAMERLKLPRKTFYDKLTRHGIRAADFRD